MHELTHAYLEHRYAGAFDGAILQDEIIAYQAASAIHLEFANLAVANVDPYSIRDLRDISQNIRVYFAENPDAAERYYGPIPMFDPDYRTLDDLYGLPILNYPNPLQPERTGD
jgi:hypothetical protein